MSRHEDERMTPNTVELVCERQRPGRMIIQVEFSPEDVQRLKRGVERGTRITGFIRQAALAEADRRANAEAEKQDEALRESA